MKEQQKQKIRKISLDDTLDSACVEGTHAAHSEVCDSYYTM